MVAKHIPLARMWDYVHLKVEINWVEHWHLVGCRTCMKLFTLCVHSKSADEVVWDRGEDQERKSA
jgi:hypothetical protein